MRVLFLATYFPKPGNPTMGVWALKQAQAFRRNGMDVRVASFTSWVPKLLARTPRLAAWADCPTSHDWDGLRVDYPRWPVYQVPPLKGWAFRNPWPQLAIGWPAARRYLDRVVREWRPDVVFAHHTAVSGYLAWRLHRRHGLAYVVTDHDLDEVRECRQFPARRRLFVAVAERASRMVGVSHGMERDLLNAVPNVRTAAVHNGSEPVAPRRDRADGRVVVFSAGIFYERKGFQLLVRAFAAAARDNPAAVLRIAGDGEQRPAVEQAVAESGVADRIELLGLRPHAEVLRAMQSADVFALVGWDEPFATVFLEAMSVGLPIVWSRDGGIADVLKDDIHGIAVEPRDEAGAALALSRLIADGELRGRMGANARQQFQTHLTLDANARRMRELFDEAVAP